jgi:SNF2 family DNA or RNA helicase
MIYKAHDYQKYATDFVLEHESCGLILDLGLGKTIIVLSALWELLLDRFEIGRVLVIAPLRVGRDTWPAEIEKWDCLKGLTYSVVIGSEKERRAALQKRAMLYIINRENVSWLVENGLFNFDVIVIDELSSFKSSKAKRFRSLRKVRPLVKRVIGMTGTPGNLMDLWAEMYLLDQGKRLGKFITHYRNTYFDPDKRNQQIVFSYKPKANAETEIYRKISDICISMKAADHLKMPEIVSAVTEVRMDEKETKLYDQLAKDMILPFKDGDIDATSAVALSGKLHQMANGAVYDENHAIKKIHERKLDALEDLIEAANEKPVLIAYWYKHDRDCIMKRFNAVQIDTSESIRDWNAGKIPVALIHPGSAAHGLNLQEGGHLMIWYSMIWSLELYKQTIGRIYRQGQSDTVVIQHLVTKGTIDEDVLKALEKKDLSQEELLRAVKARIGGKA